MWTDGTVAYFMRLHSLADHVCTIFIGRYLNDLVNGTLCSNRGAETAFLCELPSSYSQSETASVDSHHRGKKREGEKDSIHLAPPANVTWPLPVVTCPEGHVTVAMLACDPDSVCWQSGDGFVESEVWGVPTKTSCGAALKPLPAMMVCDNSAKLVLYSLVCDHVQHCDDGSDEICVFQPCPKDMLFRCSLSSQVNTISKCSNCQYSPHIPDFFTVIFFT